MTFHEWKAERQRQRIEEVVRYFETVSVLANFLSLPHSTVNSWLVRGRISRSGAQKLAKASNNRFPESYTIPGAAEWYKEQGAR